MWYNGKEDIYGSVIMEILAPAGAMEQLIAAVRSGANAVYLGTKNFNARRSAGNFDDAQLIEAVNYCHERSVKVHVTFNTLITDLELSDAAKQIEKIALSGADAAIIQDLAVFKLFREICPDLPLHASTQMSIHNLSGAKQLEDMGYSRVVLAREVSLTEIEKIRKSCDIELESFVHGALCMSVSGQCYLSAMLGGRSGNRGMCAQPCRLEFTNTSKRPYALSLKDMSYVQHIKALEQAGICSIKIEGRMKRPEYVAAAVTACKNALRGEKYDIDTLRAVFSRGGFTDGYLTSKIGESMFGIRDKGDVISSATVFKPLQELYRNETPLVGINMHLTATKNLSSLYIDDGEHSVYTQGPQPLPATGKPMDEEYAKRSLSKTGGTPYFLKEFTCDIEDGIFMPASALNKLRSTCLEQLSSLRMKNEGYKINPLPGIPKQERIRDIEPQMRLRFLSANQIVPGFDYAEHDAILPIDAINADPSLIGRFKNVYAEVDELVFALEEEALLKKLLSVKANGVRGAYCNNIGALKLIKEAGLEVHGGTGLNVLNSMAAKEFERLGLKSLTVSFEGLITDAKKLSCDIPRGVIAYGNLPVMLLRSCPNKKGFACPPSCNGRPLLKDRMGVDFPLICKNRRYSVLLNSVPVNISDKDLSGLDFVTLYFTNETSADCIKIIEDFKTGESPSGKFTRGLYYKKLQ